MPGNFTGRKWCSHTHFGKVMLLWMSRKVLYSQIDRAKCLCIFANRDMLCSVSVNAMQQAKIVKNKQAAPRQVWKAIQKVSVGW